MWVVKDLYLLNMVYGWSVRVNLNRTKYLIVATLSCRIGVVLMFG